MATEPNEGAQPEQSPSPISKTDESGAPILQPSNVTLPEDGSEPTVEEAEGGEVEAGAPVAAAQPAQRGKNRVPAKQRINQLWHEARNFQSEAERLAAENEALKQQMAQTATKSAEINISAMAAHENSWKNVRELARRELIDAKNAADPAKEADAIAKLSRAESELGNIEAWRANQPAKPAAAAEPAPKPQGNGAAEPTGGQPVTIPPVMQAWVERNLWAVNDTRNPDFDPEMANYMANQANILEMRLRRQDRAAEIGTETYFDEIDRLMREEFPDHFDDTGDEPVPPQPQPRPAARPANQRQAPQMQRNNGAAVAPASATAGQQAPRGQAKTVNLTAEERQFAHGMARNGALKYPPGTKQAGKPMSDADAEVAYARQKLSISQNPTR